MNTMLLAADVPDAIIPIVAMSLGGAIWITYIIAEAIRSGHARREREQSRREIAAYVAEGSMTPEQGVELMKAGEKIKKKSDEG